MAIVITTKHISNANGRGQVLAKGAGKQRTVSWLHEFNSDRNHGLAAGALAEVLGLAWSDTITHEVVNTDTHKFTFQGVSLTK